MSVREDLTGARWSSATRCIAKAEYQALGFPPDEDAQTFLLDHFVRGVNAADSWVTAQEKLTAAQGKTLLREHPIPWGPNGMWTGHADAVLVEERIVVEAYHAVGGVFREEKALQVAGYALRMQEDELQDYRAMLAVLDTTDVDEDSGFAVTMYPVEPEGLREQVENIEARVSQAFAMGEVEPADKIGDTPMHRECQGCPFRAPCWEGWEPIPPVEVPEIESAFTKLGMLTSIRGIQKAALDETIEEIYALRDEIRPYAPPGIPISAGGVSLTRKLVAPRVSFRLSAYLKAGHLPDPTMESFIVTSKKTGERWPMRGEE